MQERKNVMKFCKECGDSLEDNAVFCSNCGANATLEDDTIIENSNDENNTESITSKEEIVQINEQSDKTKKLQSPPGKTHKKKLAIYIIMVFCIMLVGVTFSVAVNTTSSGGSKYKDKTVDASMASELSSKAALENGTTGTAHFSYCLLDRDTYRTIKQMGVSPNSFSALPNVPWKDTTATVYELSNFAASDFLYAQGNQRIGKYTSTIMIFQTIAKGSSKFDAVHTYTLAELYVNDKPAIGSTHLYDGDEVKAVITF